jgi:hypothetical protein
LKASTATVADRPEFVDWLYANREQNKFDPETFTYKSTQVLKVEDESRSVIFLPYTHGIVTESLAPRPGLSTLETARGLKCAVHEVVRRARAAGIGEVFFIATDQVTQSFAEAHGYTPMPAGFTLMRLKVADVQPPLPEDTPHDL